MLRAATLAATCARSDLERDALTHPSFVHVPAWIVLDHVSSGLVEANRTLPMGATDTDHRAVTFSHIAALLGVHCALCGTVRRAQAFRTSLPFCKWLCGDFDGTCLSEARTYPLCHCCNSPVITTSRATSTPGAYAPHIQPVLLEDQFPAVLCSIYADRAFARRVETNAENFQRLRFDPRAGRSAQRVAA